MGFLYLIIVPTVLMSAAIFADPYLSPILKSLSRQKLVASMLLLLVLSFLVILIVPGRVRWNVMHNIKIFGAIPLTSIAGFFIQSGLRGSREIRWWRIGVGLALLVLACFLLGNTASLGYLGPLFAIITALSATGVAIVTGVWMVWSLPRWRKLGALVVGVTLPLTFFASIWIGKAQSPEEVAQKNGDMIVQALEQCYTEVEAYPTELTELVPVYMTDVPEALTTQGTGWLYISDGSQYTLGYWDDPRWFGVNLCLHSSESKEWQCEYTYSYQDWEPFSPVSTPTPAQ